MKIKSVKVRDAERPMRSRIYFFHKGESIPENLEKRWKRPYEAYRELLPEVFKKAGIEAVKASWSQRAGCGCGCSPGFILDDGDTTNWLEIFVEVA